MRGTTCAALASAPVNVIVHSLACVLMVACGCRFPVLVWLGAFLHMRVMMSVCVCVYVRECA